MFHMDKEQNLAYIDGQNLYYGTKENNWKIDFKKFRIYLRDKYNVTEAFYFFGYIDEQQQSLYTNLQQAGFIVTFREHISTLKGQKKGNVDTDIVFEMMKALHERKDFNRILLISGDGDYKKVVDYLITCDKFKKILFPNRNAASSLYRQLAPQYFDHLERPELQKKIGYLKKGSP